MYILSFDEELRRKALPHVDVTKESVDWQSIFNSNYSSGHNAAVQWAYCIWTNQLNKVSPFEVAHAMDAGLKHTVLRALAIRWRIPLDHINPFHCA